MTVKPIKTKKIVSGNRFFDILDEFVPQIQEGSVLAITSKILAICQGRIAKIKDTEKIDLIKRESDYYIDPTDSKYGIVITVKDNFMVATAGIDESNGNGYYVLWPSDLQDWANKIKKYLKEKYNLKNFGVIITDSKTTPLKKGTTGFCIAHSGFFALKNYIDKPDIFGKQMHVTEANHAEGLAAAAVLIMGEGDEQTPLAIINDLEFIAFNDNDPEKEELDHLNIALEEDLYYPILKNTSWIKGENH